MDRRDFLRTTFRNVILSGIVITSGYLIFKEKSKKPCNFDFACKKCKKLDSCTLPEAKELKSNS
jgi:hypothetical protein